MTCIEGTVHLVGSDALSRGRVKYCYNGQWHSVCANEWDTFGNEAKVVCKTMGYDISQYCKLDLIESGKLRFMLVFIYSIPL